MKLVIVACNTAAATGLERPAGARRRAGAGVIEPGVRSLAMATHRGRVGVIGTVGTIGVRRLPGGGRSGSRPRLDLTCAACPGFVEFVERGETRSDQVTILAERLLAPVREAKVDALLLGCTHYPFLARTISDVMGRDVVLVDSADETAFEVRHLLAGTALARDPAAGPGTHRWLSSGDVAIVPAARPAAPRPGARRGRGRHLALSAGARPRPRPDARMRP